MNSKFLSWSGWDLLKGGIMAALGVVLSGVYVILSATPPHFPTTWMEWMPILVSGASAFVAYMIKNLFTNSAGQIASQSTPQAKAAETIKKTT